MVAFPERDRSQRSSRLASLLLGAGMSGETADQLWMAERLTEVADVLDPGGEDLLTELLLAAAHLQGLHETDAAAEIMVRHSLPCGSVEAMRELLRTASLTPDVWQYIRQEICRLKRPRDGQILRWEIDGEKLLEVSRVWHELGERVMFRRLVRAFFRWVAYRQGNVEVVIRRAPSEAGPRWVRELREALECECGTGALRISPLIAWEAERIRAARSESRQGPSCQSGRSTAA